MSAREAKAALRRELRAARAALDPADRAERSRRACERLLTTRPPRSGERWAMFAPLDEEASPEPVARAVEAVGGHCLYPRVEQGELSFVIARLEGLVPGHFGVREPAGAPALLAEAAVIVVPGLAFDDRGHRLGYGRGYYDRALRRARSAGSAAVAVGFGLELQRVHALPIGPEDEPLDALVTESRWLSFERRPV